MKLTADQAAEWDASERNALLAFTADQRREAVREAARARERRAYAANPRRAILNRKRRDAKREGYEFTITEADLDWPTHCPITGRKLRYGGPGSGLKRGRDNANIDRIDNTRGYVPGNVTIVSEWVNKRKGDASLDELRRIVEFYTGLISEENR